MFTLLAKLGPAGSRHDALQRAGEDQTPGTFRARELDPAFGHLSGAEGRRALPVACLDPVQRSAHQVRQLEFEEDLRVTGAAS